MCGHSFNVAAIKPGDELTIPLTLGLIGSLALSFSRKGSFLKRDLQQQAAEKMIEQSTFYGHHCIAMKYLLKRKETSLSAFVVCTSKADIFRSVSRQVGS